MWYMETRNHGTDWSPAKTPDEPETVETSQGLRLKRSVGVGPRVRCIKKIGIGQTGNTLAQLQAIYSPHGQFRGVM